MRRPIIAGNWKMFKGVSEAKEFMQGLLNSDFSKDVDVVIAANYLALAELHKMQKDNVYVIAQNFHEEKDGAYTGEVSIDMLKSIEVDGSLIGHSERRKYFNETDEVVNKKVRRAIEESMYTIVCVGEVLEEREAGKAEEVVISQTKKALDQVSKDDLKNITIAYEPVWAIGTGKTATDSDAEQMCAVIRNTIKEMYGDESASLIRILYGGSVKPNNIKGLMSQENIDGALVGGASLELDSFLSLVNY